MWRPIKVIFAVSVVSVSLAMTLSSSFAQEITNDDVGPTTTTTREYDDDDDDFDFGWIGLAGLAGLAGLMPRDRHDRTDHTVNR